MKKIIYISIFALSLHVLNYSIAFSSDMTVRYYVHVNQVKKGLMSLVITQNSFSSEYFDLNDNDRIPFYCPKKSGKFEKSIYSTKLIFGSTGYDIYNDYKDIPEKIPIIKAYKRPDKTFMVDSNTNLPKLIIDKIPMVTLENVIIGILKNVIKENEFLYLYEESSKSQFKIYYERMGKSQIILNNKNVWVEKLIFKRKNIPGKPDKPTFEVNICQKNIPVRIASLSKRWELYLYEKGQKKKKYYDRTDKFLNKAKITASNHHNSIPKKINITDHKFISDKFNYFYNITYPLSKYSENSIATKYFEKMFKSKSNYSYQNNSLNNTYYNRSNNFIKTNGLFIYNIDDKDICEAIDSVENVTNDCKYIEKNKTDTIQLKNFVKVVNPGYNISDFEIRRQNNGQYILFNTFIKKEINLKEALSKYLKNEQLYTSLKYTIELVKIMPGFVDSTFDSYDNFDTTIRYSLSFKEKINYNSDYAKKKAAQIIGDKLSNKDYLIDYNRLLKKIKRFNNEDEKGYKIVFSTKELTRYKHDLLNNECFNKVKTYSNSKYIIDDKRVDYDSSSCTLYMQSNIPQSEISLEESLFLVHPELKYFQNEISVEGKSWSYYTVPVIQNICE